MIEPLEKVLADVGRFPQERQRDAADCILRTLRMDAKTFAKLDRWRQEDEEKPPLRWSKATVGRLSSPLNRRRTLRPHSKKTQAPISPPTSFGSVSMRSELQLLPLFRLEKLVAFEHACDGSGVLGAEFICFQPNACGDLLIYLFGDVFAAYVAFVDRHYRSIRSGLRLPILRGQKNRGGMRKSRHERGPCAFMI
jgi:hypothetical protein